jgi:hypothetical protein
MCGFCIVAITGVNMDKEPIRVFVLVVSLIALFYSAWFMFYPQPKQGMVYDCRLAEISPDYPPAIKNECREMMARSTSRG